jgi:hypothetical protein
VNQALGGDVPLLPRIAPRYDAPIPLDPLDHHRLAGRWTSPGHPWVIRGLLPYAPDGAVTFLAGEPKTCKTYLALYFAICVAGACKVFERFDVRPGRAILFAEEDARCAEFITLS